MELRRFGSSGPTLSAIGLGCNNFGMTLDEAQARDVVHAAMNAGVTHFDTAEKYGNGLSESVLGNTINKNRSAVTIATKFSPRPPEAEYQPGDLARRIVQGCEGSLRRLGTDYIDLYYQHFPDPEAPEGELFQALGQLVEAGKVRHVAISNADVPYIQATSAASGSTQFCGLQTEWSLLSRGAEDHVVPAALSLGWGIIPYFPLASGMLTGKYQRGQEYPRGSRLATLSWSERVATDENFARVERLSNFAVENGHTLLELALGWLLSQRGVASVIAGATSSEQVKSNVAAAEWALSDDEMRSVDALLKGD